jgi:pimeloyl-ACP methyl ester carboxylesterase
MQSFFAVCLQPNCENNLEMKFIEQFQKLKSLFTYDCEVNVEDISLKICPFQFEQKIGNSEIDRIQQTLSPSEFCSLSDDNIEENKRFVYTVFVPQGVVQSGEAILLLHGLNERSWEKYLPWAEQLANRTGRAIILFPIAFHMNRTPRTWYNPRAILPYVNRRKQQFDGLNNSTFVNLALSSRLSENPIRFYISGKESIFNLWQLIKEIKNGQHPLFKENTSINIFAYSIGAFLAQVLLLANPEQLTSDARLFMFCGGALFSRMNGNSRDIMDCESFQKLRNYLLNEFIRKEENIPGLTTEKKEDSIQKAFKAMLSFDQYRDYRESFFQAAKNRIRAITLKNDTVIPTLGVEEAFGKKSASGMLEEIDFPYEYSHQIPFPTHERIAPEIVQQSFSYLFDRAATFLA